MMPGCEIKLLITDFDGTLVDTFRANYLAYRKAFEDVGLALRETDYRRCFGYRFEKFMEVSGIADEGTAAKIKELKSFYYPDYFKVLQVNNVLLQFLLAFKRGGGKIAVASTARRRNLENVLGYIGIADNFDYILAGEEVRLGKPSPEIYEKVLAHFGMSPHEALVFEDSQVGIQSAQEAGINYFVITQSELWK